ncbi:hypothetical protein [Endozoicomonas sp. GU-1]|uniref:hypothetical protein n=1 Tax=Endozoicomonas sp. GU-1 TaxID=3009078 RepID=UPI0022B35E3A|nr:hypothetical protein [Endozoicomonas sp. GU-1]WBA84168.1 hypothetical protein O3276_12660 [Endozoicomonas sp. GU-1]
MISGNPIPAQNVLGTAQDDPASTGSGSWLGRAINVLKAVTCFVSGVAAVVALSTGFCITAAVCGAIFAVSGLSLLFGNSHNNMEPSGESLQSLSDDPDDTGAVELCSTDQSEPVSQVVTRNTYTPSHYTTSTVYRGAPTPVKTMSPPTVNDSTNSGRGLLPKAELVRCNNLLDDGIRNVHVALDAMRLYSLSADSPSLYRKHIGTLRSSEPFDENLFLLMAKRLKADESVIDGHQQLDKAVKIDLLEKLVEQLKDVPKVQLGHVKTQMVNLENLKEDLQRHSPLLNISSIPDPVPESNVSHMKRHVDALDSVLANIRKRSLADLIDADDSLHERLSEADAAIKKCRNILNGTDRKYY